MTQDKKRDEREAKKKEKKKAGDACEKEIAKVEWVFKTHLRAGPTEGGRCIY